MDQHNRIAATLIVALGIALAITGIAFAAPGTLLRLLDADPDVVELAIPYLLLVLGTTPLLAVSLTIERSRSSGSSCVEAPRKVHIVRSASGVT